MAPQEELLQRTHEWCQILAPSYSSPPEWLMGWGMGETMPRWWGVGQIMWQSTFPSS